MDFTALELGLRNRQLLQVKCFLRIQIETFRYFLIEVTIHANPQEQAASLESFFHHDWQNVVNKISSFAAIQMSGDYSSKIFSTLLYRSLINSCNQLILIFSSISTVKSNHVFPMSDSITPLSSTTPIDEDQLSVTIEKILLLLIRQIDSVRESLSRSHTSEIAVDSLETFNNVDPENTLENDFKYEKLLEIFEKFLAKESIPAFQWLAKNHFQYDSTEKISLINEQLAWKNVIEKIIQLTASNIRESSDVDRKMIEEINFYLMQTGLPVFDLLFVLITQTCDAVIRQKLLKIFSLCFNNDDDSSNIISKSDNYDMIKSKLNHHFEFMSIIDMYIFCHRPKINEDETLQISIEWILKAERNNAIPKSLILPILDEISIHPVLFDDWKELYGQILNSSTLNYFHQQILTKERFSTYLNAEKLWQYLINNNRKRSLIQWIENNHIQLPYCSELKLGDDKTSRSMFEYVIVNSSLILKNKILLTLALNPHFFSEIDFADLIAEFFEFRQFLGLIGQTNIFSSNKDDCDVLKKFLNKVIKLPRLIEYCIQNEFFEFLFFLFNRYKPEFDSLFTSCFKFDSEHEQNVLNFLKDLCRTSENNDNSFDIHAIFEKSFFIQRFLNGELNRNHSFSFKENFVLLLDNLFSKKIDLDLIIFLISFSTNYNFDDILLVLQQLYDDQKMENLVKSFLKSLNSKYPIIYRALQDEYNISKGNVRETEELFPSQQVFSYNIYTFLQESIPFVNINKLFEWQINRGKEQHQAATGNDQINDINELPHFSQKRLAQLFGMKSNLTPLYYLKNSRLIEAFLCFSNVKNDRNINNPRSNGIMNEKTAIKAVKKASMIAYNSIKNDSIITSVLLFQSLVKSCMSSSSNHRSTKSINETLQKNVLNECEKFCLHLALGELIIEYAADFLNLQSPQLQQNVLASLLRRSHFNSDRNCSQKLLDLATVAIERKYSMIKSGKLKIDMDNIDVKLYCNYVGESEDNTIDLTVMMEMIENCPLLIECFQWRPLFIFAQFYSLNKPFYSFIQKCTIEDNWLVLVIFAQIYEIPKEEVQELLSKTDFNNQCIREHLSKAFQSSRHVSATFLSDIESKILKTKQNPHSSRNVLYSKLFREKMPNPTLSPENNQSSPPSTSYLTTSTPINSNELEKTFPLETDSPENVSIFSSSIFSKLSEDYPQNIRVIGEQIFHPKNVAKDFLQLILDIYRNCMQYSQRIDISSQFSLENSFKTTLLYASASLSNPILALLACSLTRTQTTQGINISSKSPTTGSIISPKSKERSSVDSSSDTFISFSFERFKYPSFSCWLLASVDRRSKQMFIDWYNQFQQPNFSTAADSMIDCYTNWSPDRLLNLIDVLTSCDARNFQKILQGVKMFDISIPILPILLDFLIGFLVRKDYYDESINLLLKFQSSLMEYNEEEFVNTQGVCDESGDCNDLEWMVPNLYSRNWIEKCSLVMITNSLLIAKQYELNILLSHYNFVRIQDSFSPEIHRVPDIRRIYLFSQCLNKVPNHPLPIAKLIQVEINPDEPESKHVDVLRKLIFDLQDSDHFEAARNIINLLPVANSNEFIINEWMLKAKKAEVGTEPTSINIDISFWENCWSQVCKLDPSMHSAFKVMERFVQQLETQQILIKCFVLLKCLLAIEAILKDYAETEVSISDTVNIQDDSSTICSSNTSYHSDLLQDYFNFEISFWKSVVECEFYIQTTFNSQDNNEAQNGDLFIASWKGIWKDVVSYFNSSIISKTIFPKINEKHPLLCKNIENHYQKQKIVVEVFKHDALNKVIGNLLDFFCLVKAQEVTMLFNYSHEDFEIISACDQAARGSLKDVSDAPLSVQLKMKNSNLTHPFPAGKVSLIACDLNIEQQKIISMLETFSSFATIGRKFCEYILLQFKIACFLDKTYSELKDCDYNSVQLLEIMLASNQIENNENEFIELERQPEPEDETPLILDKITSNSSLLIDKYMETILCAKKFIQMVGKVDERLMNEEKIVDLLAQFVFDDVQRIVDRQFNNHSFFSRQKTDVPLFTEIELDRAQLEFNSARFSVLIRLLHEPSLLGYKLLELAKKSRTIFENTWNGFNSVSFLIHDYTVRTDSEKEIHLMMAKRKHYVQTVELYIRAHECFTSQCLVGGIALVLRKTRLLITNELQPSGYFHLILRLLTGIGRYSEMTYCFDLFRECDRFELILSKRVQRTPQLRIALLNYLKNAEHIEELLPLVAIRFFLYRETADQHRARAEKMLSEINFNNLNQSLSKSASARSLSKKYSSTSLSDCVSQSPPAYNLSSSYSSNMVSNRKTTSGQLETIMYEYQEAETNYTKAACYANADYCAHQAQLVALQLFYISKFKQSIEMAPISNTNLPALQIVLNLDSNQVEDFINQCTNFYEALIVAKSYPKVNVEWADAFFNNAIINNNVKYVGQFLDINEISVSFLEKLIRRYEVFVSLFRQQQPNIKSSINTRDQLISPSSPLPSSFLTSLAQVRSEIELHKNYLIMEQIFECILCNETMSPCINLSLKDRYQLAKRMNSEKILRRLLENHQENYAYLLDLKSNISL